MNLAHLQQNRFNQIASRFQQLNEALVLYAPEKTSTNTGILVLHAVVKNGTKANLITNLNWLSEIQHIAFHYLRVSNGRRIVFSDGVFCEIYLHEPKDLTLDAMPGWHNQWQRPEFQSNLYPNTELANIDQNREWLIGELLTSIIIGLRAYSHGERLSAFQSIQQNSLTYLLKLTILLKSQSMVAKEEVQEEDLVNWETHFPELKQHLPEFAAGYERTPESSVHMLRYLESKLPINYFIKDQILNLAESCQQPE